MYGFPYSIKKFVPPDKRIPGIPDSGKVGISRLNRTRKGEGSSERHIRPGQTGEGGDEIMSTPRNRYVHQVVRQAVLETEFPVRSNKKSGHFHDRFFCIFYSLTAIFYR